MTDDTRPILFLGDIQGCAGELAELLEQAAFDSRTHRLIPLGDTINRGPDAAGAIALLRQHRAEPVLGNHELALLREIDSGAAPVDKPGSGRLQLQRTGTLDETIDWMRTWPLYREGKDWIAVHAGLHPELPPERTPPEFLTGVRFCDARGERPAEPDGRAATTPPGFSPWFDFYDGPRTVVFGHWARMGLIRLERLFGLDTGCVYGRQLSALWWPGGRLVQVPSRQPMRYRDPATVLDAPRRKPA